MSKERWSKEIEEDLILLIKDWLKQTGRTQSELCQTLNLSSARMPTLIAVSYTHLTLPTKRIV